MAAIWNFGGYFGILPVFWGIFLLENVNPSHYLILKCKIPLNSIKQDMLIFSAKFKPYFYTRACKWMGFSQMLPHIYLSLIKMARNPTQKVKIYHIWYQNKGNVTFFSVIWIKDTPEVPSQHQRGWIQYTQKACLQARSAIQRLIKNKMLNLIQTVEFKERSSDFQRKLSRDVQQIKKKKKKKWQATHSRRQNYKPLPYGPIIVNLKRAGGGIRPPRHFLLYLSRLLFFALKLHDFFPSSLALNLKPFFF